jgi:hypothetical protein
MDRSRVSFVVVGSKGFPSASGSFPSPSSEEALGTMLIVPRIVETRGAAPAIFGP